MNISIIGGGAAGMLLGIIVKRELTNAEVVIFERNDRVGKKLLATGNGRCNYTNIQLDESNFHSTNKDFPMKIVEQFDNNDTIEYLKTIGIYPISEKNGRVYPLSLQGSSVLDLIRFELKRLGVKIHLGEKIDKVSKAGKKFLLEGSKKFPADVLVVATGGMAMPSSGSDGIGYRIAKEFGHMIIDQYPTIVQLESDYNRIKALKGVRIDTEAFLYLNGKRVSKKSGDVLFTDYGLSGPAILDLSRDAIQSLEKGCGVEIGVNLVGIDKKEIETMIKSRMKNLSGLKIEEFFIGIINKKIIHSVINMIQFHLNKKIDIIYYDDELMKVIVDVLSDFRFNVSGYKGFGNAQSTTGGVDTLEIKDTSCESKLIDDLYFIGEVLDVDGDCGGYNLQWAWSSAYAAGSNIIRKGR